MAWWAERKEPLKAVWVGGFSFDWLGLCLHPNHVTPG